MCPLLEAAWDTLTAECAICSITFSLLLYFEINTVHSFISSCTLLTVLKLCCSGSRKDWSLDRSYFSSTRQICCGLSSPMGCVHICMLTIHRFTAFAARTIPLSSKARCLCVSPKVRCGCGRIDCNLMLTSPKRCGAHQHADNTRFLTTRSWCAQIL